MRDFAETSTGGAEPEAGYSAHYHVFETAFGWCGICWTGEGVSGFQLPSGDRAKDEDRLQRRTGADVASEPPASIAGLIDELKAYFRGERADFSELEVDLAGVDPFHARILAAARRVGWGEISSYGALAREVAGDVAASRGVGQAMGRNPIPVIIPCHRILAADGKPGGFSAPGGVVTKLKLLDLEGSLNKTPALAQTSFGF